MHAVAHTPPVHRAQRRTTAGYSGTTICSTHGTHMARTPSPHVQRYCLLKTSVHAAIRPPAPSQRNPARPRQASHHRASRTTAGPRASTVLHLPPSTAHRVRVPFLGTVADESRRGEGLAFILAFSPNPHRRVLSTVRGDPRVPDEYGPHARNGNRVTGEGKCVRVRWPVERYSSPQGGAGPSRRSQRSGGSSGNVEGGGGSTGKSTAAGGTWLQSADGTWGSGRGTGRYLDPDVCPCPLCVRCM